MFIRKRQIDVNIIVMLVARLCGRNFAVPTFYSAATANRVL